MTTLLRPVPSGSSVLEAQFPDGAPVTALPDLSLPIGWFVDDERSLRVGFYDDALTAVDIIPVLRVPVGGGMEALLDVDDTLEGYLGRPSIAAHQVPVTGLSESSALSFSLEVKGATAPAIVGRLGRALGSAGFRGVAVVPEMLQEALDALADIRTVAREEDCEEPSESAIANARILIREMFALSERTYDVYPMSGGEIAIDVGNRGRRIGVFCYADGKVQYVVLLDDERHDIRTDGVNDFPTALLMQALNRLES